MDQQQLLQVPELRNGNIGTPSSLEALDTRDTNANMRRLDHADIIGTVSDGQEDRSGILLDKLDDESFLQR